MIYKNQLMLNYECANKAFHPFDYVLNSELKLILDTGFICIGECIFLDKVLDRDFERSVNNIEEIKDFFLDFSGIENSHNKIHIDDYVEKDLFEQSFLFLHFFKIYWSKNFPDIGCFVALSFQDDEVGKFANFSFHKRRENEFVFDIDNINNYIQPVYFEIFN